jgi:perosamine synthetase
MHIPYFRPSITAAEIDEVTACLESGWLTTGPRTRQFEESFAEIVGARHAVAVNSATAALHLAVEALGLKPGQAVLVPTMTFAATAEIVRHQGAIPLLVDCDPVTFNMDLNDAERKLQDQIDGRGLLDANLQVVGIIPVHVGGLMMDMSAVRAFADRYGLWVVEDAAHAFPAAYRQNSQLPWQRCGEDTAALTCFSFYANKTMTTGEGGMAVTHDGGLADRIRKMSLHGLTDDAWNRFSNNSRWDYRILAPGYKYNLTDIAASLGNCQLRRAEEMRCQRESVANYYREFLHDLKELELPPAPANRIHAWHLFPIRLRLDRLTITRDALIEELHGHGIGCSVHWRPLHLHPYYEQSFGWCAHDLPAASAVWKRLISLPLFPSMQVQEQAYVVQVVRELCHRYAAARSSMPCLSVVG